MVRPGYTGGNSSQGYDGELLGHPSCFFCQAPDPEFGQEGFEGVPWNSSDIVPSGAYHCLTAGARLFRSVLPQGLFG